MIGARITLWLVAGLAMGLSTAIAALDEAPREVRLEEKKLEALSAFPMDELAFKALALAPQKWKHAETPHFIVHYRRATEAQKVVREVEYDLWFAARALGASNEQIAHKSHVFIFQDRREWEEFRGQVGFMEWSSSVACGGNLYLHVGGMGENFNSNTLAHETAHAVVDRIYPGHPWPHWLNEGFAEYCGSASIATRKQVWAKGILPPLSDATYPLEELTAIIGYPKDRDDVRRFYQTSEKLVCFLITDLPAERFPRLVGEIIAGTPFTAAAAKVYGDQVGDYTGFVRRYNRFAR
ncbi:MAG: hypothetical protein ACFUZC_20285 [Chthoniobacteraceae bacterium]